MDKRTDSGEFYPGGDRRGGDPIDLTFDDAVTRTSARAVKSSGIWGAIWGALAALPTGVASLYDWCVAQLAGKLSTSGGIVHGLLESNEPLGQSFTGLGVNGMVGYYGGIRWGLRIGTGDNVDFPVLLNKNGGEIVIPSAVGTLAFLSDIPDISGKADAADLRYRIAEAEYSASVGTAGGYLLADRAVNSITATDETSIDIELPEAVTVDGVSCARDFLLDVANSVNANDLALEFVSLGASDAHGFAFATDSADSIGEIMTIGAGERVRLYFTETSYCASGAFLPLPVIHVARVTLGDFVTSTATQGGN